MAELPHSSHPEPRLGRVLMIAAGWIARYPWLVLIVCAITIGWSLYESSVRLSYRTQRDDLMSSDKACQVRWRHYLAEFGSDDDIVFVIEGKDRARMQAVVEKVGARLRAEPNQFDRVFDRTDLRPLRDRALLYLSENELRDLAKQLDDMGPLLSPASLFAWRGLTLRNLIARAQSILSAQAPGEKLSAADVAFLEQFTAIVASAERSLRDLSDYANPWTGFAAGVPARAEILERPRFFFSDDGTLAFLLARPATVDRQSFTPIADAVKRARTILKETKKEHPDLEYGLTGLPVLENDEMAGTDRDSMRAFWLALGALILLYMIVYRGLRYPLMTVISLLAGTFWALGLTTITIGHLNILSSAFAVMLIGMGDYGVLWVARFDEERKAGRDVIEAIRQTAAHAGPSILTAAVTTSLAFYAIMLADFQAVTELGFIAGSGVLLCALSCFILMPVMIVLTNRKKKSEVAEARTILELPRAWMPRTMNHPRLVVGIAAGVLLLGGLFAAHLRYDPNLLNLQSQQFDSVMWEKKLLDRTTGTGWHALSIADSPEQALDLKRKYEQLPEVGRVDEVASLMPAVQERKFPLLEQINQKMQHLPSRAEASEHRRPDGDLIRGDLEKLRPLLTAQPELRIVSTRLSTTLVARPEGIREEMLVSFERKMTGDLWDGFNRLKESSSAKPITLDDLPPELRERYVGSSGKWLVRAFARDNVWEHEALGRFVEQTRTVDPEATGKPFGTLEGLRSMKEGFEWAGVYALIAIVLILALDFRDLRCVLLGLLPLAIGVVSALALLKLFGVSLNPANLVALPLIVGVGVDNGVHVLHDYRSRRPGEKYRMSNATGRGILVAALTTILGFAALMASHHKGMFGLGLTLTLGVTCCMIAALVVLPATLRLLDGRATRDEKTETIPFKKAA